MSVATEDAVARYCEASETNAMDELMATLAPDVEIVSPISGRMVFRGTDDVRTLLTAVYGSLRDFRWTEFVRDGDTQVVVGGGRVLGGHLTDAMVFDVGADGRITRIRPHLRPWLGLTLFALVVGPKVARHPGIVWRALRARP